VRTSVENRFALLLFSIGSIHTYFGASGKLGAVHIDRTSKFAVTALVDKADKAHRMGISPAHA
jgi:hypothetical protein